MMPAKRPDNQRPDRRQRSEEIFPRQERPAAARHGAGQGGGRREFHDQRGRVPGHGGRVGLRQDDRRPDDLAPDRADRGQRALRRRGHCKAERATLKAMRRNMQIIFQDPYSSLDPRVPIGESIGEGLLIHGMTDKKERNQTVLDMLRKVGMEDYHQRALSPRVLRRPAAAHRHRARAGAAAQVHRLRRAGRARWMFRSSRRCSTC